jgi:hypothetical protein
MFVMKNMLQNNLDDSVNWENTLFKISISVIGTIYLCVACTNETDKKSNLHLHSAFILYICTNYTIILITFGSHDQRTLVQAGYGIIPSWYNTSIGTCKDFKINRKKMVIYSKKEKELEKERERDKVVQYEMWE